MAFVGGMGLTRPDAPIQMQIENRPPSIIPPSNPLPAILITDLRRGQRVGQSLIYPQLLFFTYLNNLSNKVVNSDTRASTDYQN